MGANTGAGAYMGLVARGPEDEFLFDAARSEVWDVRRMFLRDPYTTVYDKLSPTDERREGATNVSFSIAAGTSSLPVDMVNDLDLVLAVLPFSDTGAVLRSIKSIEVRCGDRRIDGWEGTDVGTLVDTMCAVFGRRVARHGDRLFVPLFLAPFHSHNLFATVAPADAATQMVVTVQFVDAASASGSAPELYCRKYFCSPKARRRAAMSYQMGSAFTQWGGDHPLWEHVSCMKHHLSFEHPASMLLFWGVDKATVKKVALQLNGHPFYDGPLAPLERVKEQRGMGHVEPVVIFFSQGPVSSPFQSTVNFSRLDSVTMILHTDPPPPKETVVRYYAVSVHPLHVAAGACSPVFENLCVKNMFPEYGPTLPIEEVYI